MSSQTQSQAVIDEVSKWTVGLGILTMALAPLSIPILALTAVALLPLLVPLVALALVVGIPVGIVAVIRALARHVSGRTPAERPSERRAAVTSQVPVSSSR